MPPQQHNAQDTDNDVREDELQPTGEPIKEAQTTTNMYETQNNDQSSAAHDPQLQQRYKYLNKAEKQGDDDQ